MNAFADAMSSQSEWFPYAQNQLMRIAIKLCVPTDPELSYTMRRLTVAPKTYKIAIGMIFE